MTCPVCHAETAEGEHNCARCGATLLTAAEAETYFDPGATSPAMSPARRAPAIATGVLTPAPTSAGSQIPPASSSLAYGTSGILEPGTDFGPRYRIESVLGRGGMGAVYKAYDKDLDRIVALKLVRPDLTSDPEVMQRFKQELLLSSKISHKNVLRIHDLGDVNGVKFISMAYIEGEDLHRILEKRRRLPADNAIDIGRQLCAALQAAHAEGVVHRDLKPQNVLIDQAGTAYVSDFGLAKSLEAGAAMMTRTGELLGTPLYMSPEQAEGKRTDHRSDLYALGLILYEMVTGEVPFSGESMFQVMYQRIKQDPKNPRLLNPDLPNSLVHVIMRCLERDPDRRYQSAQEVLRDLDAPHTPFSLRRVRISMVGPGHRGGWIAAGVAALLILLALAVPEARNFLFHSRQAASAGNGAASKGIPPLAQGKYIAVLPFRVLGDSASLGYVGEGLQDALSAKLFALQGVHIASGDAVERATQRSSPEQIAREVGANLIVEGTVQEAGNKIAIVAKLRDMTTGNMLWSQEFPGVVQDLLTLEDQIYSQLVGALELRPSNDEMARATRRPTENAAAYDLYLKGRDAMRGEQNPKNVEAALNYYNQALQKDPGFALAFAGTADASMKMYGDNKDRFWAQKALGAAQQAKQLNGNLPEVHLTLGSIYGATGRTAEAIIELNRALQLAPNSDEAYRRLGGIYSASGQKDKAIHAFEKAVQINPYYWLNYNALGQAYFTIGDTEKALAAWTKITELEPDNVWGYENVGAVYLSEGKYNECIPVFQKALQLQSTADNYSNLGTAYFYLKRYGDSVAMFEKATEMSPNDEVNVGNLADAYRWSGQKDKASATYDQAISLAYKALEVNPRDAAAMQHLALYYAKKGNLAAANKFIRSARSANPDDVYCIYAEGVVETLGGNPEQALKTLREAFEKGYSAVLAKNDPELNSLQDNPEFQKLIAQFSSKPQ
jgi:eukaryotic-like serine/threonine-protein kinase